MDGSIFAGLQAALDADGKPAWLRGLMGNDGNADLLQEQTGASSEEEVRIAVLNAELRPFTPPYGPANPGCCYSCG